MKATAAILRALNAPLSIEQLNVPPLEPGQVLVQIEAAGVCGSDVHMWRGLDPRTPMPIILGHEGVGRIADLGSPRTDIYGRPVKAGDRVLWERGVTCGECYYCAVAKQPALCTSRWVYGIYRSSQTPPYLNGCYATHIVLDGRSALIPLLEDSDPAQYVSASCSGATAAHGFDLSPARIGDTVVILGPGPLGAFSVLLARAAGAEQVIVIGGTESRLAFCQRMRATQTVSRHALSLHRRQELVLDLTHGMGADLIVEASGARAAAVEALGLVRHGGAVSLVGFGTPVGDIKFAPFESLVRKNVRIQGVWVSDISHTMAALSLARQHPELMQAMVTHRYGLQDATAALQTVADRQAMKAVIEPSV